jgi:hypothetical protein
MPIIMCLGLKFQSLVTNGDIKISQIIGISGTISLKDLFDIGHSVKVRIWRYHDVDKRNNGILNQYEGKFIDDFSVSFAKICQFPKRWRSGETAWSIFSGTIYYLIMKLLIKNHWLPDQKGPSFRQLQISCKKRSHIWFCSLRGNSLSERII